VPPEADADAAERDFTAMWRAALPIARDMLDQQRRVIPFAVAVSNEGGVSSVGVDLPARRRPPPRQMLVAVYRELAAKADDLRAVATVTDFDIQGGDAVVIALEHRDGTALIARVPFVRRREGGPIVFGELEPHPGSPRLWTKKGQP
jgi:hypothetical protein